MTHALLMGFASLAVQWFPHADDLPGVVRFNQDIRPLLSDNCFFCHGPDGAQRKADLRLDTREGLLGKPGEEGTVVPGKPDMSDLVARLREADPAKKMPPPKSGKKLDEREIKLIEKWIAQGAKFEGHWSFEPLAVSETQKNRAGPGDIDRLIAQRLKQAGLKPVSQADKRTLLRRLSFDLTGLPPTPEEMDAFLSDNRPDAYERQVDRLLGSTRHAERMTMWWLDLVRYADSVGYHGDQPVSVHPYRKWVVDAFAANMPFDRFTLEQVAGDLLPKPTEEQKIAAGYNRLGMMSAEGGVQPKEYLAKYIAERVRNVSGVWLGITLGCAECHDHKYDPFTSRDFYRMEAFFADIKEVGLYSGDNWGPNMRVANAAQRGELAKLESRMADLEKQARARIPAIREKLVQELGAFKPLVLDKAASSGGATLTVKGPGYVLASGKNPDSDTHTLTTKPLDKDASTLRLEVIPANGLPQKGPGRAGNGNFVLTEIVVVAIGPKGDRKSIPIKSARASLEQESHGEKNPYGKWSIAAAVDGDAKGKEWGWAILPEAGKGNAAELVLAEPAPKGSILEVTLRQDHQMSKQHTLGSYRLLSKGNGEGSGAPTTVVAKPGSLELDTLLRKEKNTPEESKKIEDLVIRSGQGNDPVFKELVQARGERDKLVAGLPTTLVTETVPPRMVRVLRRGNWMDDSGEVVTPGTPAILPPMKARGAKADRLDLAKWLTSPENPLTARTTVNRLWKLFFGYGLSRKLEDLGSQGEWPTHPELLDTLAARFVANGWDMRALIRMMVTSEAYKRQSSDQVSRQADPDNRLLARQGRWRIDAEMVRDTSLAVSGLLVEKVGGASVYPYQPAGYWAYLNFPTREWQASTGEGLHRRSLYTHWQRQYLHPAMQAFDAPSREECTADRARSNTPLQSLVLLNDPIQVEAARALAMRALEWKGGKSDTERLVHLFRLTLQRSPEPAELGVLTQMLETQRGDYRTRPAEADKLLGVGTLPKSKEVPAAEQAAWVSCARVLLNLHETITRE